MLLCVLQLVNRDIIVLQRHQEDAVRRAGPHLSFAVKGYRSYLHERVVGIAPHDVLGVVGLVAAVFAWNEHVDAAAVGCNPDVALSVLYRLVGSIAAERPSVGIVVAEVLDVVAATGQGLD